jgi:AcrR family transcriptional regulator
MTTQRQQQKEETARRIFVAALHLFRTQGYEQTTVEAITRAAGVAKGTFFTHFASKDALLDHIGQIQIERIATSISADPGFAQRSVRAQLHLIIATLAAGLLSQPAEMRTLTIEILARRSLFDIDPQGIGALDALLAQIVANGQASGEIRTDAPANRLAMLARGSYFLAVFEWVRDESIDLAALAANYLDLVLDGLMARSHDPSRTV